MDLGLADRVVIITGGNRGIGRACAAEFLAEGAKVVIAARDTEATAATCKILEAHAPGRVLGIRTDIQKEDDVRAMVEQAVRTFGRLDVLVNNAGGGSSEDFFEATDESWSRLLEQKLNGAARCIRYATPHMRTRKWGRIINMSGGAGRHPSSQRINVALNNAALLTLTKALATTLGKDGILVNAVLPHTILTERRAESERKAALARNEGQHRVAGIPVGRAGKMEEISAVVAFLASERAGFVNGIAVTVDGGAAHEI